MNEFISLDDARRSNTSATNYVSFDKFNMTDAGLFVDVGKRKKVWVSDPFEITGCVRDPNGEGWGKLIRWRDPDQRIHTWVVRDAVLHEPTAALAGMLAERGLRVATKQTDRAWLVSYFNLVKIDKRVINVNRTGWHELSGAKVFVFPSGAIGNANSDSIILDSVKTSPYAVSGSLDNWRKGVGQLTADHRRAVFAVSASLTAPLLALVGMESGGFHLYGQSSRGKTTLAQAAASVWGRGDAYGFVKTWRGTVNGLEGAAVTHSDTPLVLDELGVADSRDVAAAVYQLAGSFGKIRASKDGSLRPPATWRTMLISTGELRVTDKLIEAGKRGRAGQEVRLLDVPADADQGFGVFDTAGPSHDPKALADAIKTGATTHYGTVGPAFIEAIIGEGVDRITEIVRCELAQFRGQVLPAGTDAQVQRAADRFGLVAIAGELAREFGIVPWKVGAAKSAAEKAFADWLVTRGGTEPAEVRDAIAQVAEIIARFGEARFESVAGEDRPVLDRLGWKRGIGPTREWLIPPETWRTVFCAGYDPTMVARSLYERGMLRRMGSKFSCVQNIEGHSKRVYVLTARLVSEETGNE